MYVDIHCHITGEEYDSVGGVEEVLSRAQQNGVELIICSGFDLESSREAKTLAERFESVYFCAGFHPSELRKYREGDFEKLRELCSHKKCVAVGEIGLDYHFEDNPAPEMQRELFFKQLELADEVELPVVIHSRDAAEETLGFLKAHANLIKRGGLMHCYSYSPEMVKEFEALGLYFSFGGPSTFKNAKKVQNSVRAVPATRLLSETDCPYLTPVPFRGTFPNEPKNVKYVVENMAEILGTEEEKLKKQIYDNAKTLFRKIKR